MCFCLPWPLSDARSTTRAYLKDTMTDKLHSTSETAPMTSASRGGASKIEEKTYKGEVPISPYTTPRVWKARYRSPTVLALCRAHFLLDMLGLQCPADTRRICYRGTAAKGLTLLVLSSCKPCSRSASASHFSDAHSLQCSWLIAS